MAAQTELSERILDYGTRIIKVVEALPNTLVGRRISDQLLRSGLSVGANFEEAQAAESTADFAHKLQIALKEAREASTGFGVFQRGKNCRSDGLSCSSTSRTNWWRCYRRPSPKPREKQNPREIPQPEICQPVEGNQR